ncbi:hypothetical protein KY330_05720 [Candidatus Woesearchaeota archaeon]|nr:hypothetical protein [Candidatus Woesearchaeota archaeon]
MFRIDTIDIHIDLSKKYWEKCPSGIAFVTADKSFHKGCTLSHQLKDKLRSELSVHEDYAKLHAAVIWHLIKDISWINNIILCHDENVARVTAYLDELSEGIHNHISGTVIPLTKFSEDLARKIKSPADKYAKAYRRRGLKPWKWDIGIKLNVKSVNFYQLANILSRIKNL